MAVEIVNTIDTLLDIHRDLSVTKRQLNPGPPDRIAGMTVGVVKMSKGDRSPHNGEMHPDGDEILVVSTGIIRVVHDSGVEAKDVCEGQACVVRKGEWHTIECIEDSVFTYITPGPNGQARFK